MYIAFRVHVKEIVMKSTVLPLPLGEPGGLPYQPVF